MKTNGGFQPCPSTHLEKKKFTPAPEGLWQGVCVDIVDLGMVDSTKWGPKHKVELRWVIDAEPPLPTGKPHMASRRFTNSLGKKSALRPFLEVWRGRKFTTQEIEQFDLEVLLGVNGQVQVSHNSVDSDTYANVDAVVACPRTMARMSVPSDYVRVCHRPDYVPPVMPEEEPLESVGEYQATDVDIPF